MLMAVDTAVSVPVNAVALCDDTDFKSREEAVTYNQAGLDLVWNFVTPAGVMTQTAVTPTDTAGVHDWTNVGNGMYKIEIPASAGTINNSEEGYGWFTGFATGILPWTGPIITFAPAHVVNGLVTGSDNLQVDITQLLGTAWLPPAVAGTPDVNALQIGGSVTAATRLSQMFAAARLITVDDATQAPSTTVFETDQTVDAGERYTEQVLFGLDGNNVGVTVPVTGYAFTNSKVKLTVELLPTAPSNGHRFLIMGRIEQ